MDFTKQSPVILSLCPGMRGLERGFDRACERLGWLPHRTAAYVEIEAFINWNLVKQMEQSVLDVAPIWSNIKTFDGKPFCNKIHGIFGGYPCQPFSLAGERKGTEDPRHLWPYISSIIKSVRPVFCFFENVAGHLSMGFGEVYRSLRDLGYSVEAGIYSAAEVGAPHRRERLFILAISNTHFDGFRRQYKGGLLAEIIRGGKLANTGSLYGWERKPEEQQKECTEEFQRRAELADSSIDTLEGRKELGRLRNELIGTGELVNPTSEGFKEPGLTGIGELQTEEERRLYNRPEQSSNELAYATTSGLRTQTNDKIKSKFFNENRWPANPGQEQYDWEEPRTKSRLGFTTHGYNFREDLLRMAGNGVVEQTAELAFIELLKKHFQ